MPDPNPRSRSRTLPSRAATSGPAPGPDTGETRRRILDAAGPIFAARGFDAATVREICAAAGSNVASIHYHFGDKAALYAEVLAGAHARAFAAHPAPRLSAHPTDPEERLRAFVRWFLFFLLGGGTPSWLGALIAREIASPTPALDRLVHQSIRSIFEVVAEIVAALLPEDASPDHLRRATLSVLGQCLIYKHGQAVIARLHPGVVLTADELERTADHVASFSIAALRPFARRSRRPRSP